MKNTTPLTPAPSPKNIDRIQKNEKRLEAPKLMIKRSISLTGCWIIEDVRSSFNF